MTLQERIQKDIQDAMRAKDSLRLDALRMMKSAVKNKEVEKIKPLDENECLQVFATLIKQRKDSIEQFTKGGRLDLAAKEAAEIKVIEEYMPAAATAEEVEKAVAEAIAETGASSIKDMGGVMKAAMAKFTGKPVDGKVVSELVRRRLSS
ncbi:MAG: GatB/YqeY domain-containing protein [Acidobacteriia bacterium]|nr:GatB/YqeY domain-containing protein [Terriglobia bacterium]